ncbi:MAG: hypothetical protein LBL79_15160 [Prevotella sp.]|nr:hypothetical protein [Prevotella sp.]
MIALVVVLSIFVVYVLLLWKMKIKPKVYKTVSAGDTNKNFSSTIELNTNIYEFDMFSGNEKVNPKDYDAYVVIGDSMKDSGIRNRDFILVEKLYGDARYNIRKDNVLLLAIDRSKDLKPGGNVQYKLRKHLSYIDSTDSFDTWINNFSAENKALSMQKEYIRTKYEECVEKYRQNNSDTENFVFTFSSTLDEVTKEVKYSFHPIKFLNGVVQYVLKNEGVSD